MVPYIKTIQQFSVMIIDDHPISKDGLEIKDMYAYGLKNGSLDRQRYINLCFLVIPESLILFHQYPQYIRFVGWIKDAGINTPEVYSGLVDFIKNKWTENAYPERLNERAMVFLNITDEYKHIISFDEIIAISPETRKKHPWWVNRLLYVFDPVKALDNLHEMPTKGFAQHVMAYIPTYLKTFLKEDLRQRFEKISLPKNEKLKLLKWLDIFGK